MKKFYNKFLLSLVAILVIPSLIRTALAPTAIARFGYSMRGPLVGGESGGTWRYPAGVSSTAAPASSTASYLTVSISPAQRNAALAALQPTAVTPWVRPAKMMQPVGVPTSSMTPFSAPSSSVSKYQPVQTQIVTYIPEPKSLEDAKNIFIRHLNFNPEGRTKSEIRQAYLNSFFSDFPVIYEGKAWDSLKKAINILLQENELVLVPQAETAPVLVPQQPTDLLIEDGANAPVVQENSRVLDRWVDFG
jgi:hypothetical protein